MIGCGMLDLDASYFKTIMTGRVFQGYNICSRTRALDAIPFNQRLVFDMKSSFGVDIRHPWDLLGYSVVTYW
jgi:hypothetical protein